MAFNAVRFGTLQAGQTGAGILAHYNGSGTASEGGDTLANIKGSGFITSQEAKDAVAMAEDGRTTGKGLPIFLVGNDGMEWDVLWNDNGTLKVRGGNYNIS